MAGRSERAKSGLPEPLTPPAKAGYDYMARLLRCRLLGEAGQDAAATTLVIEVRQECAKWFKSEASGSAAARERLAALVQCRLARQWQEKLKTTTAPATAPLDVMLGQLQAGYFADKGVGHPQVYFLDATIPVIVDPPAPKASAPAEQKPAATTAPGSTSDSKPAGES